MTRCLSEDCIRDWLSLHVEKRLLFAITSILAYFMIKTKLVLLEENPSHFMAEGVRVLLLSGCVGLMMYFIIYLILFPNKLSPGVGVVLKGWPWLDEFHEWKRARPQLYEAQEGLQGLGALQLVLVVGGAGLSLASVFGVFALPFALLSPAVAFVVVLVALPAILPPCLWVVFYLMGDDP